LFYLGVVGDGSGGTLASYAYDPFGNTTVTSGSSTNPCEYTGRENDGTGLQFSCARYYSPTLMNSDFISFQYDPFGRRTGKTVAGITTNYLYDGVNVAQEISGGSPIANLLSGRINQAFTRTDSNGTANLLTDALGSTLALTDSSGNSLAQYAYEPFGNTSLTSGSSTNEFEYTGRENDGTGLYFYRARYYNPTLQRFISEDPAGFVSGADPYLYTRDEPSDRIDPSGLTDITITVVRQTVSPQSIIGQINVNAGAYGQVNEYSLENASTAISPGSYPAYFRTDSGPGLNHEAVTLYPADGRTNIEIHPGNSPVDSTGCILPGTSTATDWVNHSQAATGKINDLIIETIINDIVNGQPTTITVIVENPPPTLPPSTAGRKK
jgi:RHS repeat-associated protein